MGVEAECKVRVGRKASSGKALIEGNALIVRGDLRLEIPFAQMQGVAVEGDALVIRTAEQQARLELGAAVAERWARLIKEPKGLFEKLELGADAHVAVVDIADSLFLTSLHERTASVSDGRVPQGASLVFLGAETRDALRKVALVRARLVDDGVLWIVRPKGGAKAGQAPQAITEKDVFAAVREAGLVDVKVVAFSKTHTAHKCVIPVELRGKARRRPAIVTLPPPSNGAVQAHARQADQADQADQAESAESEERIAVAKPSRTKAR